LRERTPAIVEVSLTRGRSNDCNKAQKEAEVLLLRQSDKEVTRLIGDPGVYICDACVSICNRVLEATPIAFPGWQAMTDDQLLRALKIAEGTVDATRSVLQAQIVELRRRKISWDAIGNALGSSRQAAWERFS
jgi:hypothetical protein